MLSYMALYILTGLWQHNALPSFAWLEGEWKRDNTEQYEIWQVQNDTITAGGAFENVNGTYIRKESMRIECTQNRCVFYALVYEQNQAREIPFNITSFTDTSFTAQNPQHDFPQQISYELRPGGSLHAIISGTVKGKLRKVDFYFTKQP